MRRHANPTIELLRKLPGLRTYDDRSLAQLAPLVDVLDIEAGKALTREGRAGRESFLIVEGWAEVTIQGETVATLGPGQFVGEMAMLENQPRTATVTARTAMTVLVIGPQNFSTFVAHPGVSLSMATELAERLRRTEGAPTWSTPRAGGSKGQVVG
jgi:CRP/FNR family cyclic AMP-dependent transcriptional regulator